MWGQARGESNMLVGAEIQFFRDAARMRVPCFEVAVICDIERFEIVCRAGGFAFLSIYPFVRLIVV